ncbi:MAG: class I SAM-dependent methyltransferase [Tabrizicola sp.]|uniref:class I SAM-dependent methyltransferase n=1 Tax=Tabrizicola sp. TaxID=2005166 RepID=UPI0027355C5C|nr:class I SAM-dependent methyltransferase [Tabrizicola sp.]MDP3263815.1 class I SAM-dependent methyltransferase [Tabrizicola sp.]MDP3647179.1 class I SAM-dependent methyltransferase [Paracoccaceae bacterium]MDZ4067285.1 class I SAM-dependent methyltransferase [Tabrizicola sp.]
MTDLSPAATSETAIWDAAAEGWHRHAPIIRRWLERPTRAMIDMAGIAPGQTVLDVAAGAGDQSLDLAQAVGPTGHVTATDISPGILRFAASAARAAGHANVTTHRADAAALGLPAQTFDAAICRLGLMFLPDPLAGLRDIRRTLKPGARLATMVFAPPDRNPCLAVLMATALKHANLPPQDPFAPGGLTSLGRPGHLADLFAKAGFHTVAATTMDAPFHLARTGDYMAFVRDAAGPIRSILAALPADRQQAAWDDIARQLAAFQGDAGWVGPNTLLLTVGTC